ncbi:MAG: alpha/beta hydrolase [Betaproteobacteria bacterium]|nr:alpha/beta hydrolase [Betaproteobacteria bacterium]
MKLLGHILLGLVLGYAALAALLFFFQSRFVYYPEMGRGDSATPALLQLPFEEVRLPTADGETLHGWFVPAREARATVLFLHGNAGSIVHRLDWLPMFQRMRLSVLLVDYRGFGRSTGSPSEAGTHADADAAWRHLTETRGLAGGSIVIFGESLGGAVAAGLAARVAPAALVLHSAFTSAPDLAADLYPFLPARLLTRFDYDTLGAVRRLRCPLLVAHSPRDEIIPVAHGRRLYEAAAAPKQWLELAGGHNDGFIFMRPEWVRAFGDFLDAALAPGRV